MTRVLAGWREGGQIFVWWSGVVRPATLTRLRQADDGSFDLSVPPGTVRVRFHDKPQDGNHNIEWERVRSDSTLFDAAAGYVAKRDREVRR
jgi:hypothetical protein